MSSTNLEISKNKDQIKSFLKKIYFSKDFDIHPMKGDGSLRQYFRVTSENKSYVLMHWTHLEQKEGLHFLLLYEYFLRSHVKIPKILHSSSKEALFLLEDLGDLSLEKKVHLTLKENDSTESHPLKTISSYYKKAIDELLKVHFFFIEKKEIKQNENRKKNKSKKEDKDTLIKSKLASPKLSPQNDKLFYLNKDYKKFFPQTLNQKRLLDEMNFSILHLVKKLFKRVPSNVEKKRLNSIFLDICYKLDQEEKRISHRDFHSRNLMIKEEELRVIDYQDSLLAPLQYDLASLFYDSYVHLNDALIEELLDYYLETSNEYKFKTFSKDHFKTLLFLQNIQRGFKACGSFASFYNLRSNSNYLKYISPCLNRLLHHLEYFREYKDFSSFIKNHGLNKTIPPGNETEEKIEHEIEYKSEEKKRKEAKL